MGPGTAAKSGSQPRRRKHHAYDESTDESAALIADEPVEVEEERPAEPNEPIEGSEDDTREAAAFED
jgi:hypothetical protein